MPSSYNNRNANSGSNNNNAVNNVSFPGITISVDDTHTYENNNNNNNNNSSSPAAKHRRRSQALNQMFSSVGNAAMSFDDNNNINNHFNNSNIDSNGYRHSDAFGSGRGGGGGGGGGGIPMMDNSINNGDLLPAFNSLPSGGGAGGGGLDSSMTMNSSSHSNPLGGGVGGGFFGGESAELAERRRRATSFRSASRLDAKGEGVIPASGRLSAVPFDVKAGARARASMLVSKADEAEQEATKRRQSFQLARGEDSDSDQQQDDIAAQIAKAEEEAVQQGLTCWELLLRSPNQDFIPVAGLRHFKHDSLFIFSPNNLFRVFLYNLHKHRIFEGIIIAIILANCVFLALADPGNSSNDNLETVAEYFFTAAFTLEMTIKIIALGFVLHQDSYLRDGWNALDFFIVCLSYLNFIPSFGNFTALRTFRVFRPLRSMNAVKGLKILVSSLMKAMTELVHVGSLSLSIIFMFAILGVQLFGGSMSTVCVLEDSAVAALRTPFYTPANFSGPCKIGADGVTYWGTGCDAGYTCREAKNPISTYYSFDNVLTGMLLVFTFTTFEAWTVCLSTLMSTVGVISFLYFFVTIIFVGFVLPNLVLAVINYEYVKLQEEESARSKAKREDALRKFAIAENVHLINRTLKDTQRRSGRLEKTSSMNSLGKQVKNSSRPGSGLDLNSSGSDDGKQAKQSKNDKRNYDKNGNSKKISVHTNNSNSSDSGSNHSSNELSHQNIAGSNTASNSNTKNNNSNHNNSNQQHGDAISFPASAAHNPLTYYSAFNVHDPNNNNNNNSNNNNNNPSNVDVHTKLQHQQLNQITINTTGMDDEFDGDDAKESKSPMFSFPPVKNAEDETNDNTDNNKNKSKSKNKNNSNMSSNKSTNGQKSGSEQDDDDGDDDDFTWWELAQYYWEMARDTCHIITEGRPRPKKPAWYSSVFSARSGFWQSSIGSSSGSIRSGVASMRGLRRRQSNSSASGSSSGSNSAGSNSGPNSEEDDNEPEHEQQHHHHHEGSRNADTPLFGRFIVAMILLNTVMLATQYYDQPDELENVQRIFNVVFTAIFAVEMAIKLMSLGPKKYIREPFNILDGLVVLLSFVELGFAGSNTISVFRTFRLLRILKLFKQFPSLRAMVRVTMHAIRKTTYLLLIVALYLFIIALLGVALFYGELNATKQNRMTYDGFIQAFLTSFQVLAVDGWVATMYQSMDATNPAAAFFFVVQQLIGNFVLLSLFLSILIDSFDDLEKHDDTDQLEDEDIPKGKGEHAVVLKIFDSNELKNVFGRVARKRATAGAVGRHNAHQAQHINLDDEDDLDFADPDEIPPEAAFRTIKLTVEMEREFLRAKRHFGISIDATGIHAATHRREVTGKVSMYDSRTGLDGGVPLAMQSQHGQGSFNFKQVGLKSDDNNNNNNNNNNMRNNNNNNYSNSESASLNGSGRGQQHGSLRRDSSYGDRVEMVEFDGNNMPVIALQGEDGGDVMRHDYSSGNYSSQVANNNNNSQQRRRRDNNNNNNNNLGGEHPMILVDSGNNNNDDRWNNWDVDNNSTNNNNNNSLGILQPNASLLPDSYEYAAAGGGSEYGESVYANFGSPTGKLDASMAVRQAAAAIQASGFQQQTFESSSSSGEGGGDDDDDDDEDDFLNFGKSKKQLRREEKAKRKMERQQKQFQLSNAEVDSNAPPSSVGAVAQDLRDVQVSLDVPGFDLGQGGDGGGGGAAGGGGGGLGEADFDTDPFTGEKNKQDDGGFPAYTNPEPLSEVTMEKHNARFYVAGTKAGKRPLTIYDISTEYLKHIKKTDAEELGADAPVPEILDLKELYAIERSRMPTPTETKPVVAFGADENEVIDFRPQHKLHAPVILDAHGAAKADPLPVRRAKVCPACGERMHKPLPSAPLVIEQTADALHKLQCKTICVRKAKEQVLDALLLVVDLYMTVNESVRYDKVEAIIGQCWQCGMLLALSVEEIMSSPDVWKRIEDELEEQRAVLNLHVGEEELGKSLIGYATRCVPEEHRTNGGISLWLFRSRNRFRVVVSEMVHNPWFDRFILLCIVVNSGTMAASNPLDDPHGTKVRVLDTFGVVFTAIFTAEAVMKIIAMGFVLHPGSYLRDPWNCMDGFIVAVSLISDILTDIDIGFLSVFRTMRAIRPLRVINRNRGLKMVVRTLLESIKGIANVALIIFIVFLIFAILAVQLFSGYYHSCSDPSVLSKGNCTGLWIDPNRQNASLVERYWGPENRNFDNIGEAFLVLFEVCTGEAWIFVMWRAYDGCSDIFGPDKNCNVAQGFFFIGFYAVSGFFLIQLFVGVVVHNFKLVKEQLDGSRLMDDEQKLWVSTQQLMLNFRPTFVLTPVEGSRVAHWLHHNIVTTQSFDVIIGLFIILNIFAIAADYPGMGAVQENILEGLNYFFSVVFLIEATLKLLCYHFRYFESGWNQFDFALVLVSIIGILLTAFAGSGIPINLGILRVFRIFRILRILRLVRRARKIKLLLETIFFSLPSLANVGGFVLLTDFVFSILGVDIFATVYIPLSASVLDNRFANYQSLDNALMLLFRFQTLEDWVGAMRDLMIQEPQCNPGSCGTRLAPIYFLLYVTLCSYVITNLLIAVILDNFETAMKMEDSQVKMNDLHRFVEMWSRYDPEATFMIATDKLPRLLGQLQQPLGFNMYHSRNIFHLRELEAYHIPEHMGQVHFIETLIPLARLAHVERGKLKRLDDREIREHEEIWKVAFNELRELPVVRHRNHTCTVEQYFAATHIACSYRRTIALRYANQLRMEKMKEIARYCESEGLDVDAALESYSKNLRARVTSDSHRAVSESLVRAQMERDKKKRRRRKKQSLSNLHPRQALAATPPTYLGVGFGASKDCSSGSFISSAFSQRGGAGAGDDDYLSTGSPSHMTSAVPTPVPSFVQQNTKSKATGKAPHQSVLELDEYEYVDDEEEEDDETRLQRQALQQEQDREAREELLHLHSMMTARNKNYSSANSFISQLKETEEQRQQTAMGEGGKRRNRSAIIQGEVEAKQKQSARDRRITEMSKISRRRQILREGGDMSLQQQNHRQNGDHSGFSNNNNNNHNNTSLDYDTSSQQQQHQQQPIKSLAILLAPANSPNRRPWDPNAVWLHDDGDDESQQQQQQPSLQNQDRHGSNSAGSVDSGYFMQNSPSMAAYNNQNSSSNHDYPYYDGGAIGEITLEVPSIQINGPNFQNSCTNKNSHYSGIPQVDCVESEENTEDDDDNDDEGGLRRHRPPPNIRPEAFNSTMTPKNDQRTATQQSRGSASGELSDHDVAE